jgi:hypothetical protein
MSTRTHTIFWRDKTVIDRHLARIDIVEYRMYKATNKNTLRRLRGQGWMFETGTADSAYLRTQEECEREMERLNARQSAELDDIIEELTKVKKRLRPEERPAPTTKSLLLKPMGRGH